MCSVFVVICCAIDILVAELILKVIRFLFHQLSDFEKLSIGARGFLR